MTTREEVGIQLLGIVYNNLRDIAMGKDDEKIIDALGCDEDSMDDIKSVISAIIKTIVTTADVMEEVLEMEGMSIFGDNDDSSDEDEE